MRAFLFSPVEKVLKLPLVLPCIRLTAYGLNTLSDMLGLIKMGLNFVGVLPKEQKISSSSMRLQQTATAERRVSMKKNAATKAWDTRKAQAAAKKRSEAAKKAAATKKANALFAKRSAAAKKAWATRRAT